MYDQREALAFSGKLPEQQNKTGITPQLLDLLAIQKVDADKAAAAKQLALAAGQPQPTVAELLKQKAMQSARQEVMQKMGLAGLQQARPPQGPMPQQMEEPQGLPGASSNLPESYRQGGIIAFAEGGAPDYTPEERAIIAAQYAAMAKNRDLDEDALAKQAQEEYQSGVGTDRLAAIQAKREREKGLQALFERQAAERPSNFMRGLELMGRNLHGVGGLGSAMAGVSEGVNATNAGYTTQDINNYKTLSDLDDQIQAAIDANNVGAYNALTARRKEVEARIKSGLESGTQMVDVAQRALAGRQRNYETTQASRDNAAMRALTAREGIASRAQSAAQHLAGLQDASDARKEAKELELKFQREKLMQEGRVKAIGLAQGKNGNLWDMMEPEQKEAEIQKYMTLVMPSTGLGDVSSAAAAELARRRAGLKSQGGAR